MLRYSSMVCVCYWNKKQKNSSIYFSINLHFMYSILYSLRVGTTESRTFYSSTTTIHQKCYY